MASDRLLLVWDGECGFCYRTVKWLKARDTKNLFNAVAYQNAPDPPVTDALKLRAQREVLVISNEGVVWGNAHAVFKVLSECGWGWFARFLMLPPMVWFGTLGYRIVAANRHRISKALFDGESCGLDFRYPDAND